MHLRGFAAILLKKFRFPTTETGMVCWTSSTAKPSTTPRACLWLPWIWMEATMTSSRAVGGGELIAQGVARIERWEAACRREAVTSRNCCFSGQFSATGREWAAATSDGLLVYALSDDMLFSPVGLEGEDVTPAGIRSALFQRHDYARALLMALQLGDCGGSSYTSSGVMPSSSFSSSLTAAAGSKGRKSSILDEAIEAIPSDQVSARAPLSRLSRQPSCRLSARRGAGASTASTRLEFYLAFSLEVLPLAKYR